MWLGKLSSKCVREIYLQTDILPLNVNATGWKSWKAGNYLSIDSTSTNLLKDLLQTLQLPSGKTYCDHISLYRKRGSNSKYVNEQFKKVREGMEGFDWGEVVGWSVRAKIVGKEYDECRVLDGEGEGTQQGNQQGTLTELWGGLSITYLLLGEQRNEMQGFIIF